MAGKQMSGDSYASQLAGMSKNQLYEIMSQMKTLIEQNQHQAKQILVDNPLLTKALFQAQIMLGMVQPPQVMPNIQQTLSQPPQQQQSMKPSQQPNAQSTQSFPVQSVVSGQASSSQSQYPSKHLQSSQASAPTPLPSASVPPATLPPLVGSQHSKGQLNPQSISMSLQQPSQVHNSLHPLHSATAQSSVLQPPPISSQSQQPQSLQTPGILRQPLHPPLPPQPRPSSLQMFSHQIHSQMAPSMGFQQPQHMSQPMFHSAVNPQSGIGNFSQGHGQPPLPNQLPPQHLYKVGSHTGDYGSNQGATPMQVDRTAPWMSDNAGSGIHLPGLTPHGPGQMSSNVHQPRPPQLTPEMEKTLLLQVMSLTPEQINLLPPEQRHQVLQLQQMLR